MKFSFMANSPWAATGYGDQTNLILPRIKKAGHDPAVIAFYGLEGGMLGWQGMPVYPKGFMPYGQDIAAAHTKNYGAKYLFTLLDVWVFNNSPFYESLGKERVRWIPYFPIDCEPIPPNVRFAVEQAYRRIVYSKFAARLMDEAGLEYSYIPHCVDTNVLKPRDKAESLDAMRSAGVNLPSDAYIVGMVAANKGAPSRKAFTQQLEAFARFKKKHSDAVLYLHTSAGVNGEYGGVNLPQFCEHVGLTVKKDVFFPDAYGYFMGYPKSYISNVYSVMDVHLLASTGEGFGIPIVEAQACGVPVIVGDWTAMPELCFSGWKIPKEESEPFWIPLASNQFLPHIGAVADALEQAYQHRDNPQYKAKARAGALDYDADKVVSQYWLPFLAKLEEEDNEAEKEMEAIRQMAGKRIAMHKHQWAGVGLFNADGTMSIPCTDRGCEAEMIGTKAGAQSVVDNGFPSTINGITLDLEDVPNSAITKIVTREIQRDYNLDGLDIQDGDVILDVGAHVGVVSCYLGLRYPNALIYAFEPVPALYNLLLRNLEANGVKNVVAENKAVTGDGRWVEIRGNLEHNSGGSSAFGKGEVVADVASITLDEFTEPFEKIALLKIDCEGMEYEALTDNVLSKVQHLRGEFHKAHGDAQALLNRCAAIVPDVKMTLQG